MRKANIAEARAIAREMRCRAGAFCIGCALRSSRRFRAYFRRFPTLDQDDFFGYFHSIHGPWRVLNWMVKDVGE